MAQPNMVLHAMGDPPEPVLKSGRLTCGMTSPPSKMSILPGMSKVGSARVRSLMWGRCRTAVALWRGKGQVTLSTTAAETCRLGLDACKGDKDRVTN